MSGLTSPVTAERRAHTIFDLRPPTNRLMGLRRVPAMARDALRIVWDASRLQLIATIGLQVAIAGALAAQLLLSREVLRTLVEVGRGAPTSSLYPWLAGLSGLSVLVGLISAVAQQKQKLLAELTSRYAFDRIIDVSASVDFSSFEDADFFDQLQRARTSGLHRLIEMVNAVTALTTGLLTSIGIAAVLVLLQPVLLLAVAFAAVFPLLATIGNSRHAYAFEYAMTPEQRERQYLMELLTERDPAKEIRVFGAAPFLRLRYGRLTDERVRRLRLFLRERLKVVLVGSVGGLLGTAVALGALVLLLSSNRMTVTAAVTAALAMQQLGSRFTALTGSVGALIESGMFVDDFQAFLERAERTRRPADGAPAPTRTPRFESLHVDNVSFAYPGSEAVVLEDVSLQIGAGEVVALVGENGCGKTTLVKLICRLYRPTAGAIRWNGIDIETLSDAETGDEITALFQDYVQYHLAARDNIVLGRYDAAARDEPVHAAAARAGIHDFLSSLPKGYDSRLGREFYGGHELSLGQWQRLALARAFYRGGSFLVLDEPTASLDPRAEAELFGQMRELARGRSVLLVSHRLASVRTADRIYLLDRGRVVEHGDHDTLVAAGGRYAELFALQADAYLAEARVAAERLVVR